MLKITPFEEIKDDIKVNNFIHLMFNYPNVKYLEVIQGILTDGIMKGKTVALERLDLLSTKYKVVDNHYTEILEVIEYLLDTPRDREVLKGKFKQSLGLIKKDTPKKNTIVEAKKILPPIKKLDSYSWFNNCKILVNNVIVEDPLILNKLYIDLIQYLPNNYEEYISISFKYNKIEKKVKAASFANRAKTKLNFSDNQASRSRDKKYNNLQYNAIMGYEIDDTFISSIVLTDRYGNNKPLLNRQKADPTIKISKEIDKRDNNRIVVDQTKIDKSKVTFTITNQTTTLYDSHNNRYDLKTYHINTDRIRLELFLNNVSLGDIVLFHKVKNKTIAHKEFTRYKFINDPDIGITVSKILNNLDSGVKPMDLLSPKNNLDSFRVFTKKDEKNIEHDYIEFTRKYHNGTTGKLVVKRENYNYKVNTVINSIRSLDDNVIDNFITKIHKRLKAQDPYSLMSLFNTVDCCVIGGRSDNKHGLKNQKIKQQKAFMLKLWVNNDPYKGVSLVKNKPKYKDIPLIQLINFIVDIDDGKIIMDQSLSTITLINSKLAILGYSLEIEK